MAGMLLAIALALTPPAAAQAATPSTETAAMSHAVGTFDVRITPVEPEPDAPAGSPGRMTLAKTFHGGIDGTGVGEMLATMDDGQSGAYAALERITGLVDGRRGSFALVHRGVMDRGAQELSITIVPGSGQGELTGIRGVFHLTIEGGEHRYDLEYSLPSAPAP